MQKQKSKQKGITLIALVVTIIVLIILAGVSINMLVGDNGIITQAQRAKSDTEKSADEELINLYMLEMQMSGDKDSSIGKELFDKTIENGTKWDIIVDNTTNKTYGTGWNYIEKGTILKDNQVMNQSWLIHQETGEKIALEEGKYTELTYATSLGVTEGLIFNLDSSVVEGVNTKEELQEKLGDNVELVNFDWNEESGISQSTFQFDGVNDYIKIKYDDETQKNILAQNGFTFEFYGIINGGKSYDENNEELTGKDSNYRGILGYWTGDENRQAFFRLGVKSTDKSLRWSAGISGNYMSDFSESADSPWNQKYENVYNIGEKVYYTITLDCTQDYSDAEPDYFKQICYVNGEKKYEGKYNKASWENFLNKCIDELSYFCVGRCSMSRDGWWHYTNMNTYALRLYSRALTEKEVGENYQKSVVYHETITE